MAALGRRHGSLQGSGAELARRLLRHPEVELTRVGSIDYVGELLSAAHPNLEGQTDLRFEDKPVEELADGADIVLLGLPHEASFQCVDALSGQDVKILDMSGAYRLRNLDAYARFYGGVHPRPDLVGTFQYGLPELNRSQITGAARVASPGCFATCIQLALLPLAKAGLLPKQVQVVAITGSSGAGVKPLPTTHHPTRALNIRPYRALNHQHTPEVEHSVSEAAGHPVAVQFVPVAGPLPRGILATAFVEAPGRSGDELKQVMREHFAADPFVRVPERRLPEVVAVAGSNYAEVGVSVDEHSSTATVFCALDNLLKGGAGQAIQNMNLMLGLDERLGLEDPGSYP